jgi:hypothetical protein
MPLGIPRAARKKDRMKEMFKRQNELLNLIGGKTK